MRSYFLLLGLVFILPLLCIPQDKLTTQNSDEIVGISKFEATLMNLANLGKYDLSFTPSDVQEILSIIHTFKKYEENKENVVLMSEYPYVPIVQVNQSGIITDVRLSNLVIYENFNPELIKVEYKDGFQSVYFVDIPFNATFDFKINSTENGGSVFVNVPHSWIHQNLETACVHSLPSISAWEGRVDTIISEITLSGPALEKSFADAFGDALGKSRILKVYLANALQHQLSKLIGEVHFALQSRFRDLCLVCVGTHYSNGSLVVRLTGDKPCLNSIPPFLWDNNFANQPSPLDVQRIATEAIKKDLIKFYETKKDISETLEESRLQSISVGKPVSEMENLVPKVDPRSRFKHQKLEGFIEENNTPAWRKQLGEVWGTLRGYIGKADEMKKKVMGETK